MSSTAVITKPKLKLVPMDPMVALRLANWRMLEAFGRAREHSEAAGQEINRCRTYTGEMVMQTGIMAKRSRRLLQNIQQLKLPLAYVRKERTKACQ